MCDAGEGDHGGGEEESVERDWKLLEDKIPMTVTQRGDDLKGYLVYKPPGWTCMCPDPKIMNLSVQIISNGVVLDTIKLDSKTHYILGSMDECDFVYKNPQVSRKHFVLHYTRSNSFVIYDLDSKCGTTVNHMKLLPERYYLLSVGDQVRIGKRGMSSRSYVITGHSIFAEYQETNETKTEESKRKTKESDIDKVKKIRKIERELEDELKTTKVEDSCYDTNLYLDEYDAYFDDQKVKTKKKETVLNRVDIVAKLWKLQSAEVELLNRWYVALKEATSTEAGGGPESSIEMELEKVKKKELQQDRAKIQKNLDVVREEIEYNFKLLRVASF